MKNRSFEDITDLYGGAEKRAEEAAKNAVTEIEIDLLKESSMNHFRAISGEEWDEFVASIRSHGILTPITVRPVQGGKYEILAGHNRVRGAKAAGLEIIPAIVRDVDDVEASIIIADTNLQREEVTDLEKGWAYRNIFEAIARQGARTDLTSSHDGTKSDDDTSSHDGTKLRSDEIIAEKYGVSRNTVNRKIRLTYLLPALYICYEEKLITQEVAEQLSYLRKNEMALIEGLIRGGMTLTPEIAKEIRKASEEDSISDKDMERIAEQVIARDVPKPSRPKRYRVDESLFPASVKKGLREEYLIKVLEYVKEHGIEIDMG